MRSFEPNCASCRSRGRCLPTALASGDLDKAQGIVYLRRALKRGEVLFAAGDECSALYVVRRGFFKKTIVDAEGRAQVTGFFTAGEPLGVEGMGTARHRDTAIALDDSEVCVMPYARIEPIAREVPGLQRHLHAVLSREIMHAQRAMLVLGSMRAEQRVASLLLDLLRRSPRRGASRDELQLRMTRCDMGSYLGLSLETVSRLLSGLQKSGLARVRQKHVRILDIEGLERVLNGLRPSPAP